MFSLLSYYKCSTYCRISTNIFSNKIVVIVLEVVTGEYGNFTSQLKTAAIDKSWRTPPQITDSRNIHIFFLCLMSFIFT